MSDKALVYSLLADGPTDKALFPILSWILGEHFSGIALNPRWVEHDRLPRLKEGLEPRIVAAATHFPSDILFIHRDAEAQTLEVRRAEIASAFENASKRLKPKTPPPVVCVVPIRMTEAWLLFDESAIRHASGNPNGKIPLALPKLGEIEREPNPKRVLAELIKTSSGLVGRRLRALDTSLSSRLVAELATDFSRLRALSGFRRLEAEVKRLRTILTV